MTFRDAANTVITNTGNVAAGGNMLVYADVDGAGRARGGHGGPVLPRAVAGVGRGGPHPRRGDVNVLRGLTLVPNNSAQVAPGGIVVYTHLLVNNGNVTEGDGVGSFVALSTRDNQAGLELGRCTGTRTAAACSTRATCRSPT